MPPSPRREASEVDGPAEFDAVHAALRAAAQFARPDLGVHEEPAPVRVAPHALAFAARLEADDDEVVSGRLVVLHDPAGQPAWAGAYRLVCYARAALDPEMTADPALPEATWSWLEESLERAPAAYEVLAGTVTTTASARFGALADEAGSSEVELRCSWTPRWDPGDPETVGRHLLAFVDLLAAMAGLPPVEPGVVAFTARSRGH